MGSWTRHSILKERKKERLVLSLTTLGDIPCIRCLWNSMQSFARRLLYGRFWTNAGLLPDSAFLHVLPRMPGTAGAIKKFVFLGGREETTTYLCLKTYFVVSLVIYILGYIFLDFLFPLHFVPSAFPSFLPSPLTDQSSGRTWKLERALFQGLWFSDDPLHVDRTLLTELLEAVLLQQSGKLSLVNLSFQPQAPVSSSKLLCAFGPTRPNLTMEPCLFPARLPISGFCLEYSLVTRVDSLHSVFSSLLPNGATIWSSLSY